MQKEFSKVFIANQWKKAPKTKQVKSPYDEQLVGEVGVGDVVLMKEALDAASAAFPEMRKLSTYQVAEGLQKMKQYFIDNAEEVARDLSKEAGKPITVARAEVQRAIHTLEDGVEESKRIYGEVLPLDRRPWGEHREAQIQRFPLGVIAAIAPFNFPLNLVMHKVVPALASKNTIVVRPATQTPFSALHIAKAYEQSGLPTGALNVMASDYDAADTLTSDPRVKMISFTGSGKVGWELKRKAVDKKVALELGGNAAVIVHEDTKDLEKAATAIATGGFSNSGQSCISVQRVCIHSKIYDQCVEMLTQNVESLIVGNPRDENTQVASLINAQEADRVMSWIDEALDQGAQVLAGGTREGNVVRPTIIANATDQMKVSCMEVFGPLITVEKYDDFDEVLAAVDRSEYGLQAGLFTQNVELIHKAYQTLEVGGLIVNDVPTYRIDHMPYGGIKMSGVGREGVRFAIQEMTEPKLLVMVY